MAESSMPGFDAPACNGMLAPAETPVPVVANLYEEIVRALKQQDVLERITTFRFEPVGSTPRAFGVFLKAELARWAKVAREAGARVE